MAEPMKRARLTFTVEGSIDGVGGYMDAPYSFECLDAELVRWVAKAVQLFAEQRREKKSGAIGVPAQITRIRLTEYETTSKVTAFDPEIAPHQGSTPAPHHPRPEPQAQ